MSPINIVKEREEASSPLALEVQDLWIRYSSPPHKSAGWLFKNLNIKVAKGERVLLMGPSGCGKSTLLSAIAGLIPVHVPAQIRGRIRVRGKDPGTLPPYERIKEVGIVFQDPETQFCTLQVEDEIAFGLENLALPPEEIEQRMLKTMDFLSIRHLRRRKLSSLSGGEKQVVALASVLVLEPGLLLLDEVTSQLDPYNSDLVYRTLGTLFTQNRSLSCLCVEHRPQKVLQWMDRVIVMNRQGEVICEGSPWEVFQTQEPLLQAEGVYVPSLPAKQQTRGTNVRRINGDVVALCEDVTFSYTGRSSDAILRGIQFEVREQEIVALLGRNGSGKTTLLKLLVGALQPQKGNIQVCGKNPVLLSAPELASLCSYLFQNPEHQFVRETVKEELLQSLQTVQNPQEQASILHTLLKQVNLEGMEDCNPFELSMGQKRRLTVACALAVGSRLILLDEPTFGQDSYTTQQLAVLLQSLKNRGHSILLVTHDEEFAYKISDRIVRMEDLNNPERKEDECRLLSGAPSSLKKSGLAVFQQYEIDSYLASLNPLVKLGVSLSCMILSTLLFDPRLLLAWSMGAFLSLWVLGRFSPLQILRASIPFFLLGLGFLWANILFPGNRDPSESPLISIPPFVLYGSSLWFGWAMVARSVTFGLFSFLFVGSTDPMDFTVSLMQQCRLSPRKAFSLMAVHRFLPLLQEEWELIQLAHRLRGVGASKGLRGKWERFRRYTIPLIASAVRKADRVAMAMETRGLSEGTRTFRRPIKNGVQNIVYVVGWMLYLGGSTAVVFRLGKVILWKGQL